MSLNRLRLILCCTLVLMLAACATGGSNKTVTYAVGDERESRLTAVHDWSFRGRLALSTAFDSGSGSLDWEQQSDRMRLDFRGALGRGAWTLIADPALAELRVASGETFEASDVSTLVRKHVGWDMPMDALPFWVRGLPAPYQDSDITTGKNGLPEQMDQLDWHISYERWHTDDSFALPTKMTATQGDLKFKLIVRQWKLAD